MARKDTFVLEIHRPYISNTIDSIERFYDLAKNKKERKKREYEKGNLSVAFPLRRGEFLLCSTYSITMYRCDWMSCPLCKATRMNHKTMQQFTRHFHCPFSLSLSFVKVMHHEQRATSRRETGGKRRVNHLWQVFSRSARRLAACSPYSESLFLSRFSQKGNEGAAGARHGKKK